MLDELNVEVRVSLDDDDVDDDVEEVNDDEEDEEEDEDEDEELESVFTFATRAVCDDEEVVVTVVDEFVNIAARI